MKRPIKRKTNKRTANKVKGISASEPDYMTPLIEPFVGVWSGQIARLRFYESQQWVQAFLDPGNNSNLVGTTNNPRPTVSSVHHTCQFWAVKRRQCALWKAGITSRQL
jgi:hypothetical protein